MQFTSFTKTRRCCMSVPVPTDPIIFPCAPGETDWEGTSSRVMSLNGTWAFRYEPSFADAFPETENGELLVNPEDLGGNAGSFLLADSGLLTATSIPTSNIPSPMTRPMCRRTTPADCMPVPLNWMRIRRKWAAS